MKKRSLALLGAGLLMMMSTGIAHAGKAPGAKCKNSHSCSSHVCSIASGDKFGTCCVPETCEGLSAQCGELDDGCGGILNCGSCDIDSTCESNTCQPNMICGWTTTGGNPTGSYQDSCFDCSTSGCTLTCNACFDSLSQPHFTQLDISSCDQATHDIANLEGTLECQPLSTTTTSSTTSSTTTTTSTTSTTVL